MIMCIMTPPLDGPRYAQCGAAEDRALSERGIDISLSKTLSLHGVRVPIALTTIASLILTVGGAWGCPGDDDRIYRDMDRTQRATP